jgi:hypothetical protein
MSLGPKKLDKVNLITRQWLGLVKYGDGSKADIVRFRRFRAGED